MANSGPNRHGEGSWSATDFTAIKQGMAVRRLTPRECERLQGFSDDYTLIPWRGKMAPDGPRYKSIGNSWAVPVLNWIAKRILDVSRGGLDRWTTISDANT
jgi:DNA (cytosine-5)-methyltransferase 1